MKTAAFCQKCCHIFLSLPEIRIQLAIVSHWSFVFQWQWYGNVGNYSSRYAQLFKHVYSVHEYQLLICKDMFDSVIYQNGLLYLTYLLLLYVLLTTFSCSGILTVSFFEAKKIQVFHLLRWFEKETFQSRNKRNNMCFTAWLATK